ncbi:MAG: aspartate aminotransferase family protein, partial [Planctomycetes bacterium]|nr:aspartate aminotransferase family protein [Planctomycetota bacterium]
MSVLAQTRKQREKQRMAGKSYSLVPKDVPKVKTPFRRIVTQIPVPESLPVLERLRKYEPVSMSGQPLVVWDKAKGCNVFDKWGNMWLDWSSGVLVTNAGHCHPAIQKAVIAQARHGLLHNYCFPSDIRGRLAQRLVGLAPKPLTKAFILTTGAETTECAIKLGRTYGQKVGGPDKIGVVTFTHAFHGRTLGAQMAGGIPKLKEWVGKPPSGFYNVPFPDGFRCEDTSFDLFLKTLKDLGVTGKDVCAVMTETYQGGGASFAPKDYIQKLAKWCKQNDALLVFDEVQAGFGRCGKLFGFEHYGVVPDLFCCGKGITSSLPLSALVGREDVMNLYGPGEMTSTHTGSPLCCVAALANIEVIRGEKLVQNAAKMGNLLHAELRKIQKKHSDIIGAVHGKGLVAGLHIVKPGTTEPDGDLAFRIIEKSVEKGL